MLGKEAPGVVGNHPTGAATTSPNPHPIRVSCTGVVPPATSTLWSPGQAGGDGDTHLCSRSPHLCLPGWWTPGSCHTWRSGSRTCARTAGQEQSPVRQHPGMLWLPNGVTFLFLTQSSWQRGLNGTKVFAWREPSPQPRGEDTERAHQVWSRLPWRSGSRELSP